MYACNLLRYCFFYEILQWDKFDGEKIVKRITDKSFRTDNNTQARRAKKRGAFLHFLFLKRFRDKIKKSKIFLAIGGQLCIGVMDKRTDFQAGKDKLSLDCHFEVHYDQESIFGL